MVFVRFLVKVGIPFVAFLYSLHRMGSTTVFWVILLRVAGIQIIQETVDSTLSAYCYPYKAIIDSINMQTIC